MALELERITDYQNRVQIDKHSLDDEIERQADLYWRVSENKNIMQARVDSSRMTRDRVLQEVMESVRTEFEDEGSRITDARVMAEAKTREAYIDAQQKHLRTKHEYDRWASLLEAFNQRSFMLRELARLYTANYYQLSSTEETPRIADEVTRRRTLEESEGKRDDARERAINRLEGKKKRKLKRRKLSI